jgi:hypothetical protein
LVFLQSNLDRQTLDHSFSTWCLLMVTRSSWFRPSVVVQSHHFFEISRLRHSLSSCATSIEFSLKFSRFRISKHVYLSHIIQSTRGITYYSFDSITMTILRFMFVTTLLFNSRVAALQFANPFAALIKKSPVKLKLLSPIPAQVRNVTLPAIAIVFVCSIDSLLT